MCDVCAVAAVCCADDVVCGASTGSRGFAVFSDIDKFGSRADQCLLVSVVAEKMSVPVLAHLLCLRAEQTSSCLAGAQVAVEFSGG